MPYTNGIRYTVEPAGGEADQIPGREIQTPAYAATYQITTLDIRSESIKVLFGQITGGVTLTADVTRPHDGDTMICKFPMDATGHTVTFSTGFTVTASTLVGAANAIPNITFMFDAQSLTWVETARATN